MGLQLSRDVGDEVRDAPVDIDADCCSGACIRQLKIRDAYSHSDGADALVYFVSFPLVLPATLLLLLSLIQDNPSTVPPDRPARPQPLLNACLVADRANNALLQALSRANVGRKISAA
ncbi:uncharacterized protein B0H64DRAFT_376952 [Chaetomium fimeti]|uniref:Uncharacterized protein n=1 Tax=Chaetomium fimeti TaxID=1854472 RepID=A0AAE0H9G5_9PEZI|nr:hypothetical protein B0H64DRAFT_376952 [Chaetomium fimeti]